MPDESQSQSRSPRNASRLARVIKLYLDIGWGGCILGAVIMPLVLGMVLYRLDAPAPGELELPVLMSFRLDESSRSADPAGLEEPGRSDSRLNSPGVVPGETAAMLEQRVPILVSGRGELRIDTRSRGVWTSTFVMIELILLVLIYGLGQLRALFRAVLSDQPFLPENASRIRRVGWLVVGWNVVAPFLKYGMVDFYRDDLQVAGLNVSPPIEFDPGYVIIGLGIVVLAEIFHRASMLQREQSLTI